MREDPTDIMDSLKFSIVGELTPEKVQPIVERLINYPVGNPVSIFINSCGGDLDGAFCLADLIEQHNSITICVGIAYSGASLIFMSGKNRYIGENGRVLLHPIKIETEGSMSEEELGALHNEIADLNENLRKIYKRKTNLSKKEIETLFYKETYMGAEEAVKRGIATGIWKGQGLDTNAEPCGFRVTSKEKETNDANYT